MWKAKTSNFACLVTLLLIFYWTSRYAAECHFVHYNSKYESMEAAVGHSDGLAVVGFLLEAVDAPNPRFDKLVQGLEVIKKSEHSVRVTSGLY